MEEQSKTSKTSRIPCTDDELREIANDFNISLADVKWVHDTVCDCFANGQYPKLKTTYYTLRNWIRMKMERGQIRKIQQGFREM